MAEVKDLSEPICDRSIEFVELAREKVIHAFHNDKMILTWERRNERFDACQRAILVVTAVDKQFRLAALTQEGKIRAVDGNPQPNQMRNSRLLATDTQPYPCAKTESRQ